MTTAGGKPRYIQEKQQMALSKLIPGAGLLAATALLIAAPLAPLQIMSSALAPVATAAQQPVVEEDPLWPELKTDLFEQRKITDNVSWLTMEAPYRAHDAALVPIVIEAKDLKPGQYVKAMTIVIDNNPVQVAAVFDLSPKLGPLHIETRLRINQYSYVRAIVEMNDGELFMVKKYVKASGGCSAPAMKDMEAKMASVGKMKMRQFTAAPEAAEGKQVAKASKAPQREVQLMVRHPNYSGMQLNQETGYYIPAHYVEKVTVDVDGEQLMQVDGAISLSEDPIIRFKFLAQSDQPTIRLTVKDTKKQTFEQSWQLKPATELGS